MANIKTDRFGRPYQLKKLSNSTTKDGELLDGCNYGFLEIGGKSFKIETSPCNKEDKNGGTSLWMKITKIEKRKRHTSF